MNSIKNLMIIAVLAAVGYGVYVSLSRNNIEPGQPFSATKGESSTAKSTSSLGGPLALGGNSPSSSTAIGAGAGKLPLSVPPLNPSPADNPEPDAAMPANALSSGGATLGVPALSEPSSVAPGMTASTAVLPADAQTSVAGGAVRNLAPPPEAASGECAVPPSADSTVSPVNSRLQGEFVKFMEAVQRTLDEGKLAEAQLALSTLYGNPDLPPDLTKQITDLLDQLAGTVIYSREHLLTPAYVVQPGDTLESIAQKHEIPWQLLARINGLMPPGASMTDDAVKSRPLQQGMELKVVQGPFDAVVQLEKRELTLMVQNRYAGRFPIGVGRDQPKLDGEYTVRDKAVSPAYYGPDGVNIAPNDPRNPLGGAWIGLNDRIGIHGAADPRAIGRDDNRGTICVADRDLQDLFGILSVGSRVTVVR